MNYRGSCGVLFKYPVVALCSMFICWIGAIVFCTKIYIGINNIIVLTEDLYREWHSYYDLAKTLAVVIPLLVIIGTFLMVLVSYQTCKHCRDYKNGNEISPCVRHFSGRGVCIALLAFNYLMQTVWCVLLICIVIIIVVRMGVSPICYPKPGDVSVWCLNFTFLMPMSGPKPDIELAFCAPFITDFCASAASTAPWYWYPFSGCLLVLFGLTNFTACLASHIADHKWMISLRDDNSRKYIVTSYEKPKSARTDLSDHLSPMYN